MVWDFRALLWCRLGGTDIQTAVNLHRVGIDYLRMKMASQTQSQLTLSGCRLATGYKDLLKADAHLTASGYAIACSSYGKLRAVPYTFGFDFHIHGLPLSLHLHGRVVGITLINRFTAECSGILTGALHVPGYFVTGLF